MSFLSIAEEKLHSLNFKDDRNIRHYVFRICLFHITFVAMHTFELLVFIQVEELSIEYGYILYRIVMYYQFLMIYAIVCMAEMLKKRYMFLDKLIDDTLREKSKIITISGKDDQRTLVKLHKIQKIFTMLYSTVRQINIILGWTIFF
ncbi:hypothetical protein NQ314_008651 [Rhamnusium bicolor]|uniref:Gustatory receptor n=1 Tax=Rhamnusium bicolor TaxID=1586634 RepID=A0AAV8Y8D5_9CUCU|nr:hypothetical protein NQ314_008651 [Rhamnusium bicolor]